MALGFGRGEQGFPMAPLVIRIDEDKETDGIIDKADSIRS